MNLKNSHMGGSSCTWSGIRTRVIVIHIAPENAFIWNEMTEGENGRATIFLSRLFQRTQAIFPYTPRELHSLHSVYCGAGNRCIRRSLDRHFINHQRRNRQVGGLECVKDAWISKSKRRRVFILSRRNIQWFTKSRLLCSREDISPSVWTW